jgi:hypothetical protein
LVPEGFNIHADRFYGLPGITMPGLLLIRRDFGILRYLIEIAREGASCQESAKER